MLVCYVSGERTKLYCDLCGRQLERGEPLYLTDLKYHDLKTDEWNRVSLCAECAGKNKGREEDG